MEKNATFPFIVNLEARNQRINKFYRNHLFEDSTRNKNCLRRYDEFFYFKNQNGDEIYVAQKAFFVYFFMLRQKSEKKLEEIRFPFFIGH